MGGGDLTPAQRAEAQQSRASDPTASAWVSASAGSGTTKLLTDRVLRLLLAGTRPNRILCLTFTKAAAAEMVVRLNTALGDWAVFDDAALAVALARLLGYPPSPAEAQLARGLFATVLELPGGMRISTIHAFCQTLLRAFPLEAALPPQFAVLEERDGAAVLGEAREEVLGQAAGGPALAALAGLISADRFSGLSAELAGEAQALRRALDHAGVEGLLASLARALGAAPDLSSEITLACTPGDEAALGRAAGILNAGSPKTDVKHAQALRRFLALPQSLRHTGYDDWKSLLLTDKGEPRVRFATKDCGANQAFAQTSLADEALRVQEHARRISAANMVSATRALLQLAAPVLEAYAAAKAGSGALDFDDLIAATQTLLRDPGSAWVLFKLDSGLDHVLLDEAQDSNPEQWGIVRALTGEFFAGEGAREAARSVFAVGDQKQSIYAFQGADPRGFADGRAHFSAAVAQAGQRFEDVSLEVSFRSTPAVLGLVDAVFAGSARPGVAGSARPGVAGETVLRHLAHRAGASGLIELWPLQRAATAAAPDGWELRDGEAEGNPQARLAQALALRIRHMLDQETLPARADGPDQPAGRRIRPDDILILVRKRNALTRLIIRALKQADVPVGGLDRIALTAQLGVQDMLALLDVLLLPGDDLQLAALLKSPLVGLSEDALFILAHGRTGTLHAALMAHRGGEGDYARAADWLALWAARADRGTPHALIARLYGEDGVRARLLARLGPDASDGLDELLNAALAFEARHPPGLQGFLHWLRAGGAEIKRDAEASGGLVRIMTVHGAKGLQAPIVILPDTTGRRRADSGLRWLADPDGGPDLPLWAPRAEKPVPEAAAALAKAERERAQEEENRLLYVALTRAEDRLLVCGWVRGKPTETDWHSQIAEGFAQLPAHSRRFDPAAFGAAPEGFEGDMLWLETPQTEALKPDRPRAQQRGAALPDWVARPAPAEQGQESLAPSSLLDEETGPPAAAPHAPADPRGLRFRRGRLIHALLQHLPALEAGRRATAAGRFLARPGLGLPPDARDELIAEVMTLLDDPGFGAAFGPDSLAEVPIAGRLGGQLFTGQVDRLLLEPARVLLIDFKTNRPPPAAVEQVAPVYLRQMAAYRALLRLAFPGRRVECALLWTYAGRMMPLPDMLLDGHAPAS